MLLLPFLMGTFVGSPSWVSALLLVAWFTAYLASYYTLRLLKTRHLSHRGARFRTPAVVYATVFATSGLLLVAMQPWLILAAIAFIPFEAVAALLALRGYERSWVAGIASATAASLMAPVAYHVADGTKLSLAVSVGAVSWLALVGTVLHVKSTIRERADRRFRQVSIGFHAVALAVATAIDPYLAIAFGFLLLRAVLVPRQGWRPARIGAVEGVGSILVLVVALLTLP
jgi:hypothetical protein